MKKNYLLTIASITLLILTNCNSTKTLSKVEDMTEIQIPLSGKEYMSNENYFRAKQVGESSDLATAKKIATQNAKADLASNIQSLIKRVTDQYTNQRSVGDKKEFENKFEELSREVVNQDLRDIKVIGEKLFKLKNGNYQYHIAVEGSKETILNGISERINKESKLKLDFDKFQFQKIFDDEMKKFENY
ncbi:hypothetical protein MKD41_03485 [Lutibacter sp. A64]|uniref:hypothetical protein n=1 Tax=Lutibacter sp. A64 TaxID=2918526 RepID=UPI001F06039A|nr:hypothetical protein [Lutibacter sp. A64]UMB54541.1 hypothetical protein MKD41_03485 [Lutibacter sp. A64]